MNKFFNLNDLINVHEQYINIIRDNILPSLTDKKHNIIRSLNKHRDNYISKKSYSDYVINGLLYEKYGKNVYIDNNYDDLFCKRQQKSFSSLIFELDSIADFLIKAVFSYLKINNKLPKELTINKGLWSYSNDSLEIIIKLDSIFEYKSIISFKNFDHYYLNSHCEMAFIFFNDFQFFEYYFDYIVYLIKQELNNQKSMNKKRFWEKNKPIHLLNNELKKWVDGGIISHFIYDFLFYSFNSKPENYYTQISNDLHDYFIQYEYHLRTNSDVHSELYLSKSVEEQKDKLINDINSHLNIIYNGYNSFEIVDKDKEITSVSSVIVNSLNNSFLEVQKNKIVETKESKLLNHDEILDKDFSFKNYIKHLVFK